LGRWTRSDSHARYTLFSLRLNAWVIQVALPCLVFDKIYHLKDFQIVHPDTFLTVFQPWFHFVLAGGTMLLIARALRFSREITGALVLTVALGNTSFVGIPLLRILVGESAVPTAILLDQLGSSLILSTVAVPLCLIFSNSNTRPNLRGTLLRVFTFPAFVALVLALVLKNFALPEEIFRLALQPLGITLAPVALFWVGFTLNLGDLKCAELRKPLVVGVCMKLLLFPSLYFVLARSEIFSSVSPLVLKVVFLEAAMASMITAGAVAVERGFDRRLAPLMVATSILLSLVTVPLWAWIYGAE
jgi:predicted permease